MPPSDSPDRPGAALPYLVGDVGGTNARFARAGAGGVGPVARFATRDFAGPLEAVRAFLEGDATPGAPRVAALGWAGPIDGGGARLTNAGWTVDARRLAAGCGLDEVVLVNDFEAVAWSLPALGAGDLVAVGGGEAVAGAPIAALGAGTGLGVAAYLPGAGAVVGGEGGHVTLPASTDDEARMLAALRGGSGHVSAERLLCGRGIVRLYDWFNSEAGGAEPRRGAAAITASAHESPASGRAVDAFCALLGTVASDVALTFGARGGVCIAGGIVPRMRELFAASGFRARFEDKGRFSGYLRRIPTSIVVHPQPAMLGLARILAVREGAGR